MQKTLVFGLALALVASLVGGALPAKATSYVGGLTCSPSVQSAASGQWVTFTVYQNYPTFAPAQFTWSAVGGSPDYGTGSSFTTRFFTSSINETRVITVSDGMYTASCTVYVQGSQYPYPTYTPYPTWTPYPSNLTCSPSFTSAQSGEAVYLSASGGNGYSYSWSAPEGSPSYGSGSSFSTRFTNNTGTTRDYWVTVTSDAYQNYQTTSCQIRVAPYSYATPTPTPYYGVLSVSHTVRNTTRGGDGSSVNAYLNDRLQFTTVIRTGNTQVTNARITDTLPSYLQYQSGTTNMNGTWYTDGITNGGLSLGTLQANRTYTVRFEALQTYQYSGMTQTNVVTVTGDNATSQSQYSYITNGGSNPYPTYTPYPVYSPLPIYGGNGSLTLSLTGANVTRGQSGEHASVSGKANDTLTFTLRVKNPTATPLGNVTVTDYLPSGLQYVPGSTTLNGYVHADGITSGGLNTGHLGAYGEAVIKFSARVDAAAVPSWGAVTVSNTAQARADGLSTVSATMQVTLGQAPVLARASSVKTGPTDSLWLATAIAALVTALYAGYTRTARFGRRSALAEIGASAGRQPNFVR